MRRFAVALTLLLFSTLPTQADGLINSVVVECYPPEGVSMSDWKIITPLETQNMVLNPSGETTGNFTQLAGTTVTRVTTYQHYGLYSYRVETNANNEGVEFTTEVLANAIHYVTVRVRGTLPATWDWSLDGSTFNQPALLEDIDGDWKLYGYQFPAAQASGNFTLSIHQNGAGSGDFYLDGIQVEEKEYWTTYCDGSQEGCSWDGVANDSTSTRSGDSRAGGLVEDLEDDYNLQIGGMSGTGTSPQNLFVDSYAILPGGELNNIKFNSRVITLTGVLTGSSMSDFHAKKQALIDVLAPDAYPQTDEGYQPVRLRYQGAVVHKEIAVHYEGGLEMDMDAKICAWEQVAVRFVAPDPYWYGLVESGFVLDTNDSATFNLIAQRLRSTGQWDPIGPPAAGGTYTNIRAIVEDDNYIYVGGNFLNFNNVAAADYIARYDKSAGTWGGVGVGLNGVVKGLAIGPEDGDLYIVGSFTNAGGDADADYLAVWNGSIYYTLGTPSAGATVSSIDAVLFDRSGNLYVAGDFTNLAGIAAADNIAYWNGSWNAISTGMVQSVSALALYLDGKVIFHDSQFGLIKTWDGTTLSNLTSQVLSVSGPIRGLAVAPDGTIYAVGYISAPASELIMFRGGTWVAAGSGVDGGAPGLWSVAVGPDGAVYVGGVFTSAGGISVTDGLARWVNGYSALDIDLPGSATVYALLVRQKTDPVVNRNYDIIAGFDTTGTGNFAGSATGTNNGNTPAFPKIVFHRSGGTTATIKTLRNERTGQEIFFDYNLLDDETLTIDLALTKKSVSSSYFGAAAQYAVLPNSDFGDWSLLKGSNQVTSLVITTGSPTITAHMLWRSRYRSQD